MTFQPGSITATLLLATAVPSLPAPVPATRSLATPPGN